MQITRMVVVGSYRRVVLQPRLQAVSIVVGEKLMRFTVGIAHADLLRAPQ